MALMNPMYRNPQLGEFTQEYRTFLRLRFSIYKDQNCFILAQMNEEFMRTRLEVREAIKDPKVLQRAQALMDLGQRTKLIKTLNENGSRLQVNIQQPELEIANSDPLEDVKEFERKYLDNN